MEAHGFDDGRRLRVVVPEGYHRSDRRYPVVYVLDERWALGTMADTVTMLSMRRAVPRMIVVGIGYQDEALGEVSERRANDCTPTVAAYPDFISVKGRYGVGNAPGFVEWLIGTAVPFVESTYRVEPDERLLFGHSLSGLCSLWTFLTRPGFFNRHLLASPSIWWDDRAMLDLPLPEPERPVRVFMSAGEGEAAMESQVIANVGALAARIEREAPTNVELTHLVIPGEIHHSTIGAAISHGLRSLYPESTLSAPNRAP